MESHRIMNLWIHPYHIIAAGSAEIIDVVSGYYYPHLVMGHFISGLSAGDARCHRPADRTAIYAVTATYNRPLPGSAERGTYILWFLILFNLIGMVVWRPKNAMVGKRAVSSSNEVLYL